MWQISRLCHNSLPSNVLISLPGTGDIQRIGRSLPSRDDSQENVASLIPSVVHRSCYLPHTYPATSSCHICLVSSPSHIRISAPKRMLEVARQVGVHERQSYWRSQTSQHTRLIGYIIVLLTPSITLIVSAPQLRACAS